ncbi:Hypothetical predicted protein [Mytilus galloprovincialis]|uniref:Reverse transcriptase domain-containing protein n=1 Tax=Mytilus galloprovincialis TaxID=29158 RepID=A0A8B6HQ15_MYTGA|nr:Hypothetical predicted protein [Mytilus galloprovincialis]
MGSNKTDTKGNSLHNAISTNNIIVLNDGSGTRQNPSDLQLSCIDISMSSVQLAHQITWTVDNKSLYGSDHFVIQLTLNQTSSCSNSEQELIWNYKKADWDGFASSCHKQLSESMVTDNINESCTHLTNTIIKIAGEHIPSKKRRKNNKPEVPWWNENCTLVVKERNKARNKARHTGGGHDYLLYKEKEKECRNTIKLTQQQYWETFCSGLNNNNNIGQVWNTIKRMMGKTISSLIMPTLIYKNKIYESTKEKANILAEAFANVSSSSNYSEAFISHKEHIESIEAENLKHYFSENSQSYNEPFTLNELQDAIADTSDTSPGKDKVTYSMFKSFSNKSLGVLLLLYNRIWFSQDLPLAWKHSIIIPSFKKGKDSSDPHAYRPIALTSNFVKIMEKMINNRLRWYLEKNHIYSPYQSGFRQNRSTMEQIIRLDNDIQKSFLKKEYLVGVFIDFQKAFDMIWKFGLLNKMVKIGIKGNMLGWVNSFLTNRTIQVKINNTLSDTLTIQNGTPQGSCISPTLFNIMVNDLPSCINNCSISQFADDSAIWLCGKNIGYIQRRIQKDLHNIKSWCDKWGFLISPSKTVAIVFSRKKKTEKLVLTLGNSLLQVVNEVKFLGIIIDSKLTWLKHIQYIEAKCSKVLNCMKLLTGTKWGANSHSLRNIYIALIRSKIDYGCEVYNSASHSVKKILDRVQRQALRICTGAYKNVATSGLQVEMGDPPYEERRQCLITKSFLNISSHEDNHPTKESLAKQPTFLCYSREIKQNKNRILLFQKI